MGKSEQEQEEHTNGEPAADSFEMLLQDVARVPHVSPETLHEVVPNLPAGGDVIDGKFEIDQRLGMGGMGAVFSATHVVTKKRVALKWMLPSQAMKKEAAQRFLREAQVAGRIDHPNVVDVYDIGRHNNAYYLVMELLHGEPLSARHGQGGCSPAEAVALLMPVMRGVAAAHAQGVIHRDLKPGNVFLCQGPDGSPREPKVLDFGISKLSAGQTQADMYATSDGTRLGTPSYMAPEQLREGAAVDHRVDVYALGVMLYELLTGRLPFKAQGTNEMIIEIAAGTPEPLKKQRPELPNGLVSAVMKAMARSPDDRFQDVRSMALALEPFGSGVVFDQSGSDSALQGPRSGYVTEGSRRGAWVATVLAVCALIAAAAWIALKAPETPGGPTAGAGKSEPGQVTEVAPEPRTAQPGKAADVVTEPRTEPAKRAEPAARARSTDKPEQPVSAEPSATPSASSAPSAARSTPRVRSAATRPRPVVRKTSKETTDEQAAKDVKPKRSTSRAGEFKVDDF